MNRNCKRISLVVALELLSSMAASASPLGSVYTVTGTLDDVHCLGTSSKNGFSYSINGIGVIPESGRLKLSVRSNQGVYQTYTVITHKFCVPIPGTRTVLDNFASYFPKHTPVVIQIRASKNPDACQVSGEHTGFGNIRNAMACSFSSGFKSIEIAGRKVY